MTDSVLFWAAWFAAAVVGAAAMTSRLVAWAGALGVVDRPNARSSHTNVTPRGGGLAIVAVTVLAAAVAAVLYPSAAVRLAATVIPAVVIAAVSWIDDVRTLKNRVRFSVHLAAAAAAVFVLGPVHSVDAEEIFVDTNPLEDIQEDNFRRVDEAAQFAKATEP